MDSATWGTYNEVLRVIKFVIDSNTFGLNFQAKLDSNLGWNPKVFCDSDWAGDPKTRLSVTGFIIYLLDISICWRCISQKEVNYQVLKPNISPFPKLLKRSSLFVTCYLIFISK
jgi:hypothetical protein